MHPIAGLNRRPARCRFQLPQEKSKRSGRQPFGERIRQAVAAGCCSRKNVARYILYVICMCSIGIIWKERRMDRGNGRTGARREVATATRGRNFAAVTRPPSQRPLHPLLSPLCTIPSFPGPRRRRNNSQWIGPGLSKAGDTVGRFLRRAYQRTAAPKVVERANPEREIGHPVRRCRDCSPASQPADEGREKPRVKNLTMAQHRDGALDPRTACLAC